MNIMERIRRWLSRSSYHHDKVMDEVRTTISQAQIEVRRSRETRMRVMEEKYRTRLRGKGAPS